MPTLQRAKDCAHVKQFPGLRELPSWMVPEDVRRAAATMVKHAAAYFGIRTPAIHWYDDVPADLNGFTCSGDLGDIWLKRTTLWQHAMRVVAHEVAHVALLIDDADAPDLEALRDDHESMAKRYASSAMKYFRSAL